MRGGGPKSRKFCGRHVSIVPQFTVSPFHRPLNIVGYSLTCLAEEVVSLLHDGRVHDGVEEGALLALLRARRDVLVVHVLGEK